ncbi:uncharacterized protein B0T15DRAFT_118640 [Chaetomium strumarium]|uniref:Secreted protein n=1 Tax=Chaetomium strumarium TaxID=1170767 RepID=A0AAJ0M4I8_9PEZI|nr:hypothetical protein B0T15DRAFT_118640 [Chaetomium strumarium]
MLPLAAAVLLLIPHLGNANPRVARLEREEIPHRPSPCVSLFIRTVISHNTQPSCRVNNKSCRLGECLTTTKAGRDYLVPTCYVTEDRHAYHTVQCLLPRICLSAVVWTVSLFPLCSVAFSPEAGLNQQPPADVTLSNSRKKTTGYSRGRSAKFRALGERETAGVHPYDFCNQVHRGAEARLFGFRDIHSCAPATGNKHPLRINQIPGSALLLLECLTVDESNGQIWSC